jgi:sorbitol-specific phosphotransferase system component IIBC
VARLFNRISQAALLRPLFLSIGPFFRVVGSKIATGAMSIVVAMSAAFANEVDTLCEFNTPI